MHVCMYVCMSVYMYVCIYVCMYAYIMYVCMYVYACMYLGTYVCKYVCMHVCMYVCAPPVQKNRRRRRGVGAARRGRQKTFFLRFTKKFRSILKIFFLGTFLVIKALRFAVDQC